MALTEKRLESRKFLPDFPKQPRNFFLDVKHFNTNIIIYVYFSFFDPASIFDEKKSLRHFFKESDNFFDLIFATLIF